MRTTTLGSLLLSLAATLPGQLAGTYTIDPNGSGSRNFKTFADASFELFRQGVSAPVVFDVAAGSYTEWVTIYPVTGASSTNTVTFRSPTRNAAVFDLQSRTPISFVPINGVYASWIVIDGLGFRAATEGRAIDSRATDLVIRNCNFDKTDIRMVGDRTEIHHCLFSSDRRRPIDIASRGASVHHNEFRVTSSAFGQFYSPPGRDRTRVYNNLFWGRISGGNSWSLSVGGPLDFVHNTIAELAFSSPHWHPSIKVLTQFAMVTEVSNNIIINLNAGRLLEISGGHTRHFVKLQNNLYFAPKSTTLFTATFGGQHTSLGSWNRATGQDAGSIYADPQFVDVNTSPSGLKLKAGSPAVGKSSGTPAYVTDDFAGQKRASPATIGAYEGFPKSTFDPFGKGCPGASNFVPVIGYSGTLQMGSTNFAVTLAKARGGGAVQAYFAVGATKVTIPFGGVCNLLVSPDFLIVTGVSGSAPGNGTARIPFNLPSDPKLRGVKAHMQWGVIDGAATGGVAFSNAATLTL